MDLADGLMWGRNLCRCSEKGLKEAFFLALLLRSFFRLSDIGHGRNLQPKNDLRSNASCCLKDGVVFILMTWVRISLWIV